LQKYFNRAYRKLEERLEDKCQIPGLIAVISIPTTTEKVDSLPAESVDSLRRNTQ